MLTPEPSGGGPMRGIISYGGYLPYHRLDRSAVAELLGSGGGRGTRTVASYDEDSTTMGAEAARLMVRSLGHEIHPDSLWFATAEPAYLEKTNATAIHAVLRLDTDVAVMDMGAAVRSGVGALRAALGGTEETLVITSDLRNGLPTGTDESAGGDGAAAFLIGNDGAADGPIVAEFLGAGSASEEFLDRWRLPGENHSKVWEERFGETKYLPLVEHAWNQALKRAEVGLDDVDAVIVTGVNARAVRTTARRLGIDNHKLVDDLSAVVGNTGTAHPGLLLASALDQASPAEVIALVVLADGADVLLFRTTDALAAFVPARSIAAQVTAGGDIPYGKFLRWRGYLPTEPPRRPEPDRPSGSAAGRSVGWKFAFVGSRDRSSGLLHLPPARVAMEGDHQDDMDPAPMADVPATVATFTVDRVSYSESPPIVAAVIDFDGGGRVPIELTDVEAGEVRLGDRVEMTFRRLYTADGIHNYFWKARPIREPATEG